MAMSFRDNKKVDEVDHRREGTPITERLHPDQLAALDGWIKKRDEPTTKPEAIQVILATALPK